MWFRKKKNNQQELSVPAVDIPQAGEKWDFIPFDDGDPFEPKKTYHSVKIIEVRGEWVRYDMGPGPFRDERLLMEVFTRIYRKG